MYCSHCGKKVMETMLFCPFCGEPIVIPEQDSPEDDARALSNGAQGQTAGVADLPEDDAQAREYAPVEFPVQPGSGEAPTQQAQDEAKVTEAVKEPEGDDRTDALPSESEDAGGADDGDAEDDDAAAELLDWSETRRKFTDDVWAARDGGEAFTPLALDVDAQEPEDWQEQIARRKEAAQQEKHPPRIDQRKGEPVRLDGSAPKLESGAKREDDDGHDRKRVKRKSPSTLVPPKPMNPNDIFMDGRRTGGDSDDFDRYDGFDAPQFSDEEFRYEDEEEGSFFMRHLRGIVGLSMFAILILIFVIYAFSDAGQTTLAKVNLAWSASAYGRLGYESFENGWYAQSGQYYERALQRAPDEYSYAEAAANAYLEAEDREKAAAMLKRCIEIDPALPKPYSYLLKLYPEAAQRPWDVTQLLQQGYQLTGDESLKVTG